MLGHSPLVEDAAQDALVRAWTHRHACRTPERPEPWMRAIARREALRLAAPAVRATTTPEEMPAATTDTEPSLLRLQIRAALEELPLDDRRLIVGRYWHDLRDRELASLLGVEETTVRVRLHRIRRRLRQNLVEE